MHGDVVDVVGQFGVRQPHVPRLGGADRTVQLGAHVVENLVKLLGGNVVAQHDFVADDHAHDVVVLAGQLYALAHFFDVAHRVPVDPDALRHVQMGLSCKARNRRKAALRRIRPHSMGFARQQLQIAADLLFSGQLVLYRVLPVLIGRERKTLHHSRPRGFIERRVDVSPPEQGRGRDDGQDREATKEARDFAHAGSNRTGMRKIPCRRCRRASC